MQTLSPQRLILILGAAIVLLAVVALAAICVSSVGGFGWPVEQLIYESRRDRVVLSILVGLALGAAGAAYQAVLRNDLADPYLLGIASGAALGAYLWRLPFVAAATGAVGSIAASLSQQAFTFAGAIIAAASVLLIAGGVRRRQSVDPATIVLVGVIVNTLCGALVLLIFTFVKSMPGSGYVQSVMIGELQTTLTARQVWSAAIVIALGLAALIARSPHLNVVALNDDEARTIGLRVARERLIALIAASLIVGAAVSIAGPIGFVGLIAPHACRRIIGSDMRLVLPLAAIAGAILLVAADAVLRQLAGMAVVNQIVPIGVATALLGGPFFLTLLLRRRQGES